jgi:uncharacterized membrane protein
MRDVMLILHFIGLAMGLGTGFAHLFLGILAAKMSPDEARKFRMHSLVLGNMGNIGITLLVVSGLYLITPYWKMLPESPLLIAKLTLVGILISILVMINLATARARRGNEEVQLKKMERLGKITLPLAIAIVVIAVTVFH